MHEGTEKGTEESTGKRTTKNSADELLDDSNPNTSNDEPAGGVGVSSERLVAPGGVEGTGTKGTAIGRTHGTVDTSELDIDVAPDEEAGDEV